MRFFEYRHIVTFDETNLIGNVYFAHHLHWQGHCRELFLREHAPAVLVQLGDDLALVTVHCSCDYLLELSAFDEISVRMTLQGVRQNRLDMAFEYWRVNNSAPELVGRGSQQIACMRRRGEQLTATRVPDSLLDALKPFSLGIMARGETA